MKPRAVRYGKATWLRFRSACTAAGVSVASVAAELGLSSAQYLVNAAQRKGHSISLLKAREIERLTGFPVTSWPKVSTRVPTEGLSYVGKRPKLSPGVDAPAAPVSAREGKKKPKEAGILH